MEEIKTKFIPLSKVAKEIGRTPEHLNFLVRQGKIKAEKKGRNWYTKEEWIKEFLDASGLTQETKEEEPVVGFSGYIPLSKVAKEIGRTPEYLNFLVRQGKIKAEKIGRNWYTKEEWIKEFSAVLNSTKKIKEKEPITSLADYEKYLPSFSQKLFRFALIFIFFWSASVGLAYLLAHGQTKIATEKKSSTSLAENPIFNPQDFSKNYQEKLGQVLAALDLPRNDLSLELNQKYFPDNSQTSKLLVQNNPKQPEPKIAGAEKSATIQSKINIPPLPPDAWKYLFLIGSALLTAFLIFWFFYSIHRVFLQPVGTFGWIGLVIFFLASSLTLNQVIRQTVAPEINGTQFNPFKPSTAGKPNSKNGVQISGEKQTQEALVTAGELNAKLLDYVLKDSLKKNQTLAGDVYLNWDEKLKLERNSVKSREIVRHAIEAEDIDTNSITSRTIRNHTIQGEDIDPNTDITLNNILSQQIIAETLIINDEATIPILNITDEIDFGTNTIADGNFTGDWNWNGGDLTNVGTIASGAITATGNILPGTDSFYNLGAVGNEWANLYVDNITVGTMGLSGNLDMQNNIIQNIGNAGTDFTTGGGLTLAGNLNVSGIGTNYFVGSIFPSADISVDLGDPTHRFNNLYSANIITAAISTSGQAVFNYQPINTNYAESSVLINPTTAIANAPLLGLGVGGVERLRIDEDGDLTTQGNIWSYGAGNNYFAGNVGIGTTDPAGYTLNVNGTFNSGAITSSGALSLGSNTITSGLINGQTISATADFTGTVDAATGFKINGTAAAGNVLRGDGTNFVSAILGGGDITGAALTDVDDTNVTLTLTGNPTTALLRATGLTLGWTGQLAVGRGGTGVATFATNGVLYGNAATSVLVTAQGGANTVLVANAGAPSFSAAINVGTSVSSPVFQGIAAATTFGNASYASTIAGSGLTIFPTAWTATPTISGLITATLGLTANGTLDANGVVTLGDNGDNVTIDSNVWDITAAGAISGVTTIVASGAVTASNFNDATAAYNVNLGSGGSEGRGVVAGYSGGSYGGIGYNIRHSVTTNTYIAPTADTVSYLRFDSGGFNFLGAAAGTAGRTLTLAAANITAGTYNGQTISAAANFTGTMAIASTVTWSGGGSANANTAYSHSQATSNVHGLTFTAEGSGGGLDADLLDGAQPSMVAGASTIVQRNASGYILANYFNTTADVTATAASHFAIQTGSDNYIRWQTPANARTSLGLIAGGGGDIWVERGGDTMTGALAINLGAAASYPLVLTSSSVTTSMGSLNGSYFHNNTTAASGFYYYQNITTAGSLTASGGNSGNWNTAYTHSTTDADTSATNEIQTLGTSGNTITLTSGGSVTAPYATSAGNADMVDSIHAVGLFNNMGQTHGTQTDFNAVTNFGFRFVQGSTNGPGIPSAIQYYSLDLGLGSDYSHYGTAGSYGMQMAIPRTTQGGTPYLSVRYNEANSWGSWSKIYAGYADTAGSAASFTGSLAGDVTGTQGATVVGDNSHAHDGSTISGLAVADFTSPNISNWTNNSNYITTSNVSGTTNYIAKFTGTNTVGNSLIYDNGTNVGIGTVGPNEKLEVIGNISSRVASGAVESNYLKLGTYVDGRWGSYVKATSYYGSTLNTNLYLGVSNSGTPTDAVSILYNGNVGIGNVAPATRLDLSNPLNDLTYNQYISFGANNNVGSNSGGLEWRPRYSGYTKASAAIRAIGEGDRFLLGLGFFTGDTFDFTTEAVERMRISKSGKVGIGTTAPGALLHLNSANPDLQLTDSDISTTVPMFRIYTIDGGTWATRGTIFRGLVAGAAADLMSIKNGNVGIGTTDPIFENLTYKLQVAGTGYFVGGVNQYGVYSIAQTAGYAAVVGQGTGAGTYAGYFAAGTGTCSLLFNAANWACASDANLKTNIAPVTDSLRKLKAITGVTFNWKSASSSDEQIGVIAQDVQKVFPDMVSTDKDGYLAVNYSALVAPLINGVNELDARTSFISSSATSASMYVDSTGNIGLGTTKPTEKLEIVDGNIKITNGAIIANGVNLNDQISQLGLSLTGNAKTISELEIDINNQLTIIGENLDNLNQEQFDKSIKNINEQAANQNGRITSLEGQYNTIQSQYLAISEFLTIADGVYDLKNGTLKAAGLDISGGVVAGAFAVKAVDAENKTVGQAVLCQLNEIYDSVEKKCNVCPVGELCDGKSIIIKTKAVSSNSRILLTPQEDLQSHNFWVADIQEGQSFTIKISEAIDKDVIFNWWIVEEK